MWDGAAYIHMPLTLTIGLKVKPDAIRFLVSILCVKAEGWRIAALAHCSTIPFEVAEMQRTQPGFREDLFVNSDFETRELELGFVVHQPATRLWRVGSGPGEVALLCAELAGTTGQVVGVDRSATALTVARARAKQLSLGHVMFFEGDPSAMTFE